jgi:cyclohexanecarboxylate-CoA ligase
MVSRTVTVDPPVPGGLCALSARSRRAGSARSRRAGSARSRRRRTPPFPAVTWLYPPWTGQAYEIPRRSPNRAGTFGFAGCTLWAVTHTNTLCCVASLASLNGGISMTDAPGDYRKHGWWRDGTFLDDLRRNARDNPGKPALVAYRATGGTRVLDYAELARLTESFSCGLDGLGVKRGDVVAVQLPNWWELLPLGLACMRVGAQFCPLMTIYRRYELAHILRLTGARVCITVTEWGGVRLAEIVAGLAGELPDLEHVLVADGSPPPGTADFAGHFADVAPARAAELDGRELGPDEPFLILFTSGTTGESKGVLHSQNTLYAAGSGYAAALGMDATSVAFVSHAATHYTGFVQGMLVPVMLGATAVVQDVWDAGVHLGLAQEHGVTTFYGAPTFLVDLLAAQRAHPRDISRLRGIVTGSAPVPPHVVEQIRDVMGVPIVALWGMTENGPVTITRSDDPADWAAHSDGRPIGGMQVRIDPAAVTGRSDGSGRLWVRGAGQCLGYFKREHLYAACLDADGWFDTGDLARDDGRGGIRITGRVKDIVAYKGFNVPVGEIEGILARHPQVREVAVIGLPDESADEVVCAVVVPAGRPPELAALREHMAAEGVSEWFWPRRVEAVDALPRTITGKVRKVELRQRFGGE